MQGSKIKQLALLTLSALLLLQGCGWHLRGSQALHPELQSLHLKMASENNTFARSLKRSLRAMDVTLADSSGDALYTLAVSGITNERRTLSTTSTAKVAEYSLTSLLTYSVSNAEGDRLIAPTRLSTEKTYLFNSSNAVSSFEEENLLREEMQRDLIQQLIRRYRALKPVETTVAEVE